MRGSDGLAAASDVPETCEYNAAMQVGQATAFE